MNAIYKNETPRLKNYDYGANGNYFITICTQNKTNFFGEIGVVRSDHDPTIEILDDGQIWTDHDPSPRPTQIGEIAQKYWEQIPNHFSFVELDTFIIMPNHIHGIFKFNKPNKKTWEPNQYTSPAQNLGSIIRHYKGAVKRFANKNYIDFKWQHGYYDKVINHISELHNIRNYILNNPTKWLQKYQG